MIYDIRVEQHSGRPLAVVRRRAALRELAKVVPDACGIVWGVVQENKITGAGRNIALHLDDEINLEVGVELDAPFAESGEIVGSRTPTGMVVTTVHFGPYSRLHEAHQAIREWCVKQGYTLAGPNWETYGHWQEKWNTDPTKIRTDIFYLLEPDAGPDG